jgi:hypothetical protein
MKWDGVLSFVFPNTVESSFETSQLVGDVTRSRGHIVGRVLVVSLESIPSLKSGVLSQEEKKTQNASLRN